MTDVSNFWTMTNEARKMTKSKAFDLTYWKVSGRLNIQTSETSGFSLEIIMHVWALNETEAAEKAADETVHFYQRAYSDYALKTQFLNDGPIVTHACK